MSIFDTILSFLAPHECLGCGIEGDIVCKKCSQQMRILPERCYRCHKLTRGARTCSSCRSSSVLYRVRAARAYEGLAKEIIISLKFNGAQAAAKTMAEAMARSIGKEGHVLLVPVPTTTGRIRQRGYDQAHLITNELARLVRQPVVPCLVRKGRTHQVGASRRRRLVQLRTAFRLKSRDNLSGKHIILIDDVCTTGATLEAAARVVKQAGAERVEAVVYAQA